MKLVSKRREEGKLVSGREEGLVGKRRRGKGIKLMRKEGRKK